jgi:ABC-type branched-subunit amino acid transport system substrate-binding protein
MLVAGMGGAALAGASTPSHHSRRASSASGAVTAFSISALTGTDSFEGPYAASGVYPALYTINKGGGVLGHPFNIKEIDTKSDPADALTDAEQAAGTTSNVIGVQGPDSGSASTLVPFFESRHIPMISTAGEAIYDNNTRPYFWRMLPPDPANGVAMAYWAVKHDHCTKIAYVFGSDPDSQGAKPGVVLGVNHLHAKVVADVTLTPDQPSYRTQVATVLAANPQCILTGSNGPTAATFFGELQQLGHLVPVIPDESRENSQYWDPVMKTIGAKNFGTYFTFVAAGNPPVNPATQELYHAIFAVGSKLQKPLSQWQGNPFTDNNYETYLILAIAADAAHSLNPVQINAWIPKITNPGPGKVTVYTYSAALAALKAGKHIRYVGPLGPITWNKYHNFWGSEAVQKLNAKQVLYNIGVITAGEISQLG